MMGMRQLALIGTLAVVAPAATLHAQQTWPPQTWPPQSGYYPATQQAYNEGYQRGVRKGEDDGRRGRSYDFLDESDYRNADRGYRSEYGSRDRYRQQFRVGYEDGYRAGYERYGYANDPRYRNDSRYGPPGPPPWSNGRARGQYGQYNAPGQRYDLAFETGYNDGYDAGLKDGRDRRRNDPIGEGRYRSADHGYERWYGSKDAYKINYRDAFKRGYSRGYADGRSYNSNSRSWWPF